MAAEGRPGKPRKAAQAYFSLGANARENADSYVRDYYGWLAEYADQIVATIAVGNEMVRRYAQTYEQSGCDELILFPCSTEVDQVDLLADAPF